MSLTSSDSELQRLHAGFEGDKAEAAALLNGVDEAGFQWRPPGGGWSMAQVFDHMIVIGSRYMRNIDRGIEEGHARGWHGRGPYRYPWFQRYFMRYVGPPPRVRVRTLRVFEPGPSRPLAGTLDEFVHLQEEFHLRLSRAEGLDLRRVRVPSPAFKYFRVCLGMAFTYMNAHQRRHFWQARSLRADPRFGA